jgi:hypothetical protein
MAEPSNSAAVIEGLTEASLLVSGQRVIIANAAARKLLGHDVEGRQFGEVIAHEQRWRAGAMASTASLGARGPISSFRFR